MCLNGANGNSDKSAPIRNVRVSGSGRRRRRKHLAVILLCIIRTEHLVDKNSVSCRKPSEDRRVGDARHLRQWKINRRTSNNMGYDVVGLEAQTEFPHLILIQHGLVFGTNESVNFQLLFFGFWWNECFWSEINLYGFRSYTFTLSPVFHCFQ